jgi:hypothetical protein
MWLFGCLAKTLMLELAVSYSIVPQEDSNKPADKLTSYYDCVSLFLVLGIKIFFMV